MAFEIPSHFNESFTTNVELLLQEKSSPLEAGVVVQSYQGEAAQVVKQFGEVEFQTKAARNSDTLFSEIEHKQRWVFPTDYTLALPVDKEDELRMLNSPVSPYAEAMRAAWARKTTNVIIDAALGTAKTGENGGTNTAFDTSNQQIASGSAGMTVAKLRTAREKLKAAHVDMSEPMHIAMTAKQYTDLLEQTEVTSSDFNTVKALVQGDVSDFLGFRFHHTEELGVDGSNDRRCFAWAQSGIVLGFWNRLETRIGERADKEYLTQVFMRGTMGATRTQEPKVVEILCTES